MYDDFSKKIHSVAMGEFPKLADVATFVKLKYTLRSYNLKTNDAVYLIFSTLYCLSIMNSNVLDLHETLVIQSSDMSFT